MLFRSMAFKMSLFKTAVAAGNTEAEATKIAKETLLDFGLLSRTLPTEMKGVKRGILYLSFQASMSYAALGALARGDTADNVIRLMSWHRDMARWSGVQFADQPQLEAMWLSNVGLVGGVPVQYSDVKDPAMGQLFWAANTADRKSTRLNSSHT